MVTTGKRYTPKEIERYIDAVTPDEIKRVATKYLWDKDVSVVFLRATVYAVVCNEHDVIRCRSTQER